MHFHARQNMKTKSKEMTIFLEITSLLLFTEEGASLLKNADESLRLIKEEKKYSFKFFLSYIYIYTFITFIKENYSYSNFTYNVGKVLSFAMNGTTRLLLFLLYVYYDG